jgi:hypothetical protein
VNLGCDGIFFPYLKKFDNFILTYSLVLFCLKKIYKLLQKAQQEVDETLLGTPMPLEIFT